MVRKHGITLGWIDHSLGALLSYSSQYRLTTVDGRHHIQISGTVVDTDTASSYAKWFIGNLEYKLVRPVLPHFFSWLNFIDDIGRKWTLRGDKLEAVLRYFNCDVHNWNVSSVKDTKVRRSSRHTTRLKPSIDCVVIYHPNRPRSVECSRNIIVIRLFPEPLMLANRRPKPRDTTLLGVNCLQQCNRTEYFLTCKNRRC